MFGDLETVCTTLSNRIPQGNHQKIFSKKKLWPKEKINFLTSITGFIFLGSYWVAPYILISSQKSVPNIVIAASVSINIIGVFLHFASDAQKYFSLKLNK